MSKSQYPYRKFLSGIVKTRKYLIRSGKSRKASSHMRSTIMRAEDLLNRFPSEETVKRFIQNNYAQVYDLIPARGKADKRFETLNAIANA